MSHGSENEDEAANPYLQCCYLPPSNEPRILCIQWIIYQLIDQAKAALPVVTFVFMFMVIILGQTPSDIMELTYGMLFVIVGLVFFMYGLEFGVMPMGDKIGMLLPTKVHWVVMYIIAGIIGIAVTYAEPAIGVRLPPPAPVSRHTQLSSGFKDSSVPRTGGQRALLVRPAREKTEFSHLRCGPGRWSQHLARCENIRRSPPCRNAVPL
jgi:hypothetical protein